MAERLVAVLGRGVVPPETPILRADDLGALRGDGIFETMHVRPPTPAADRPDQQSPAARAWLLDAHLDRLTRSAARLDLQLPPRAALIELIAQIITDWPATLEGAVKLVCTRGGEAGGPPTVFATLVPVAPSQQHGRRDGISVVTASLGYPADARTEAPWLLGGAKTLSYAVNMASLRWAADQGADDVLWLSADGYALEGPTATLVWLSDGTLRTVPPQQTGILAGTTARYLLDHARDLGYQSGEQMIHPADLTSTDGVWLVSSVRGLAEIRVLDGKPLGPSPATAPLQALLGFPH